LGGWDRTGLTRAIGDRRGLESEVCRRFYPVAESRTKEGGGGSDVPGSLEQSYELESGRDAVAMCVRKRDSESIIPMEGGVSDLVVAVLLVVPSSHPWLGFFLVFH
jgi:hypothetical protein